MQTIFFDVDDTLYDRSQPFRAACAEFFAGSIEDPYAAYLRVKTRGDEVFLPAQRGEITMEEMYIFRICKGFADVDIELTAEQALQFQACYRENQSKICLSETIRQLLIFCCKRFSQIGLITNGSSEKQRGKIQQLGLMKFVQPELVLISGEVKLDKPDPRIYELAQSRCGSQAEEILYIGDSFEHDITPATKLGWRTIWLDRNGESNAENRGSAGAVVKTEEELLRFLRE